MTRNVIPDIRKRLMARMQRTGMAKQWLVAYVALIFIPASIVLYIYYNQSTSILEEEVAKSMQQTMKQAAINLEFQLGNVQGVSDSLFLNPLMLKYLENESQDMGQVLDNVKNLRYMIDTIKPESGIYRVRLYVDDSVLYANEQINFFPLESLQSKPWYRKVLEANGSIVWTGVYRENYIDQGEVDIFSAARMMRDPERYDQVLGVLSIDMKDSLIADIPNKIRLAEQQSIYITDRDEGLVLHPIHTLSEMKPDHLPMEVGKAVSEADEGIRTVTLDGIEHYVIHATVRQTGWKLVAVVPSSEIAGRAVKLYQSSAVAALLLIAGLLLVLMFVLIAVIMKSLNRRIQKVSRMIEKEGLERYEGRMEGKSGDFHLLQSNVNDLIRKMKSLMEETYRAQVLEREAQLRALQAQINPHFLYNTLDTINWIAIGRGAKDISQMIDGLAKYFRLSLNKGKDLVSVEDELNLASVYLDIQQTRFPHSFTYEVQAEHGMGSCLIPKLTLQPIVENALLHGIRKTKSKTGFILIRAWREDGDLCLSVADDGAGMEEELAARLLAEPRQAARVDSPGGSYGLYNVNERIRLFAGDAYGLTIDSRPGEGTTVTVRLKARAEQEALPSSPNEGSLPPHQ